MKKEFRSFVCEVRAENDEKHGNFITGRPIVLGQETDLIDFFEVIDAGALDGCNLKDVRFLVNHNANMIPLARSRNNNENSTMQMTVDEEGLVIRANLDTENNAEARSLYSAVQRGDISGMSFMFAVGKDRWEGVGGDKPTRHILNLEQVFEVSAVTFPAYEQTSIEARAEAHKTLDSVRASLESEKKAQAERRKAIERKQLEQKLKLWRMKNEL